MSIFFDYFERNYLGRYENREFKFPSYSVEFWSCYERILFDIQRTNNSCEGWHSYLNKHAGTSHPYIARFVELLRNSENLTHFQLLQLSHGSNLSIPDICLKHEYKLKTVVKNYRNFVRGKYQDA